MTCTLLTDTGDQSITVSDADPHVYVLYNYSGSLDITIRVPDAHVHIFGLYIGKNDDSFSLRTTQRHEVGGSQSDLLIKGVFKDSARFDYEGMIRIEPGAHGSHAYQKNQNLVLSDGAFVDSRPYLEICADDVRCTHGSTTGRLRADQLQYVQSRGLTSSDAEQLLVDGFIDSLLAHVHAQGGESITRESLGL